MEKILTIVGPTAVGKTAVAISIAKQLNGEIIGLDSRQLYQCMEIGTAQPTEEEREGIVHHLIGFRNPSERISAGEYAKLVLEKVDDIKSQGKTPIICGGAGLYFRALSKGIFEGSVTNISLRNRLSMEYDSDSQKLLNRLRSVDPVYVDKVHINNKKRLVRALEIYEVTGKTPSEHYKQQKKTSKNILKLCTIFLLENKDLINKKIEVRTKFMLKNGWIDEVKTLLKKQEKSKQLFPALDSIGYRQIQQYLNDEISMNTLIENIVIKTRQYARRQIQWFKKEKIDLIIDASQLTNKQAIQNILNIFNNPKDNTS